MFILMVQWSPRVPEKEPEKEPESVPAEQPECVYSSDSEAPTGNVNQQSTSVPSEQVEDFDDSNDVEDPNSSIPVVSDEQVSSAAKKSDGGQRVRRLPIWVVVAIADIIPDHAKQPV